MFASSVERPIHGYAKLANLSTCLDVAATPAAERKSWTGFPERLAPIFGAEGHCQGRLNTSPSAPARSRASSDLFRSAAKGRVLSVSMRGQGNSRDSQQAEQLPLLAGVTVRVTLGRLGGGALGAIARR